MEGCRSADAAAGLLSRESFDAVVSGHDPAALDSIALLAAVRAGDDETSFLIFPSSAPEELAVRALNGGADYLLRRGRDPVIHFPELAHAIRECAFARRARAGRLEDACDRKIEALEAALPHPVFATDPEGVVLFANASALETFGWDEEDLARGLHLLQMISSADRRRAKDAIWWTMRDNGFGAEEYTALHHDGSEFPVRIAFLPWRRSGTVCGVRIHLQNIRPLRDARQARRVCEERLSLVSESSNISVWDWDLVTGELVPVRQAAGDAPGLWEAMEGGIREWEHLVHPDDLLRLLDIGRFDFTRGAPFEADIRLKGPDGQWHWFRLRARVIERDERGTPVRVCGYSQDITEVVGREKILREREAQFRTLFYKMNCGGAIFKAVRGGMDFVVTDLNYAGEVIEGFKKYSMVGKSILEIYPCAAGRGLFKEMAIVWQTGKPRSLPPLKFESGAAPKWREYYIYILPTGDIIAIYNDVTERIEAQNQILASLKIKETLIKEVHHRVKNNLQVIASILKLQSLRTSDPLALDVLRDCRNRVFSIAMIHEGLYRSNNLARIPIGEYIRNLGEHLIGEFLAVTPEISLMVDCDDDIVLDIDTGIPCGLIIGELVTNSLKYAFRGRKTGEIRIRFAREGRDRYCLSVHDNGIGFPEGLDFRNTESLGMQLVCSLTDQLGGTIRLDCTEGTGFVIEFPAERTQ